MPGPHSSQDSVDFSISEMDLEDGGGLPGASEPCWQPPASLLLAWCQLL